MKPCHAIVLFDAVGTLIEPIESIANIYHRLGVKHGSKLNRSVLKERITLARRNFFNVGESAQTRFADSESPAPLLAELESNDEIERELWKQLVFDVFEDLDSPDSLFSELWSYFEKPEHWRLFTDVEACWSELQMHGIEIGLASNFDSRLSSIVDQLVPISNADYLFCSSQVGFRKPSPLFFKQIRSAIECINPQSKEELSIFMVGDDFQNDCVAPRLAGWEAVWLNRRMPIGTETNFGATKKREVTSLYEFTQWALAHLGYSR